MPIQVGLRPDIRQASIHVSTSYILVAMMSRDFFSMKIFPFVGHVSKISARISVNIAQISTPIQIEFRLDGRCEKITGGGVVKRCLKHEL